MDAVTVTREVSPVLAALEPAALPLAGPAATEQALEEAEELPPLSRRERIVQMLLTNHRASLRARLAALSARMEFRLRTHQQGLDTLPFLFQSVL